MTETELNVMAALAIMGLSQHTKERIKDTRRSRNTHSVVYECQKQVLSYVPHDCRAQGLSYSPALQGFSEIGKNDEVCASCVGRTRAALYSLGAPLSPILPAALRSGVRCDPARNGFA